MATPTRVRVALAGARRWNAQPTLVWGRPARLGSPGGAVWAGRQWSGAAGEDPFGQRAASGLGALGTQQARRVGRRKRDQRFEVLVLGKDDTAERKRVTKAELVKETELNPRDLIHLDSGYHRRPRPVILVRPKSVVVSLSFVRAIVRHDSVFLFHPSQPKLQRFALKLTEFLQGRRAPFLPHVFLGKIIAPDPSDQDDSTATDDAGDQDPFEASRFEDQAKLPFELRAIEGILSHVCKQYHNRTLLLSPLVKNVLDTLSSRPVEPEVLHQLLPMKDTLSQFEIETTLLRNVLTELLHNEEDMLEMLLTEKKANHGQLPALERHETVELLLENYCAQMVDIAQESYYLRKRVESTQSIIELKLDTHRNHMLRVNIQIAMGSMALALGTTLSGIFGANLTNGLEHHPTAFFWLVGISTASIAALYNYLRFRVEQSSPSAQQQGTFDSIFNHLEEIQQIMGVVKSRRKAGARHLSRGELRSMLRKIAGVNVADDDVDIIFETFDLNLDGMISSDEVRDCAETSRTQDEEDRRLLWFQNQR
ncbi:Mitochondrial inner membrane magnesium transporter mrs2 (RNA-splicing protein mrs2) [Durusdinium trenchii]|uniref:Magnesium transporter n=1 Tax=Durusdinium trenchii TaxID=1381693 RepID=A0ABP0IH26_9DINO